MNKQIALVSSCHNRIEDLCRVLPSWLYMPVDKFLICDYGSAVPIEDKILSMGYSDKRISIFRDATPQKWVLSWAYNSILMNIEPNTIVVKIDCDDEATPKLINWIRHAAELLENNNVIYGNWLNQHKYGSHYPSSGFFIANSGLIHRIGGYNPHILSYGWDDIDLYIRMRNAGANMIDAPPYILFSKTHSLDLSFGDQNHIWKSIDRTLTEFSYKELSNQFSRAVAHITNGKVLPISLFSSYQQSLKHVGGSLLESGFSFEKVYTLITEEFGFGNVLPKEVFRTFAQSSIYYESIKQALATEI